MSDLIEAIHEFTDYLNTLDAADLTEDERRALQELKADLDAVRDSA